jgi:glycogen synthase
VLGAARQLVPAIGDHSSVVYSGLEAPLRALRPLPLETPRLLCVGRLVPDKGFETALGAVARLVPRFPRLRLVIAGDGPLLSELQVQASALGVSQFVEFLGWVAEDQVLELMNDVTLVVMPSRREGLPLVAIQAAYMGRPVVATRVGGLPEVVIHGETGLLVEPGDETALVDAIASLLEHPETASELGSSAARRARERFHPERYLAAYEALYRNLVN